MFSEINLIWGIPVWMAAKAQGLKWPVLLVGSALFIACGGGAPDVVSPSTQPTQIPRDIPALSPPTSLLDSENTGSAIATLTYVGRGIVPKRIEIDVGQQVRFTNESDRPFWPASNIHPTHKVYPEFDAKAPIIPGEAWVFVFRQAGFWRYHNHLDPSQGGLVVVKGDATRPKTEPLIVDPEKLNFEGLGAVSAEDSINLFRDEALLARFVERHGPANTVKFLSDNEHLSGGDCHQTAHVLGRIAFELFGALAFSLSGHECHSGGYHGATEAFFSDHGTSNLHSDITLICSTGLNQFFRHQCVHGVGHGLMAWTNYELLDALGLCSGLTGREDQESCYSGVFMENVVGGLSGSMGHITEFLSDDPHFPCNILEQRYVPPCYFYQTSHMQTLFGADFQKIAEACAEAPQTAHRLCFQSMGRDVGGATRGNPELAIKSCSQVAVLENRLDCQDGAVQDSFWDAGGADDALGFCRMLVGERDKTRCFFVIVNRAHQIYENPSDLQAFCGKVEAEYRKGCP